jgi:ATP-dependent DNA helicase DinG
MMIDATLSVTDILGPEGLLAREMNGFEFRSSQLEMARIIEKAISKEMPAVVEAGTGTGKTLAYLVPVMLSGKKTVISTGTKNLQEQIFQKDIPLIEKTIHLGSESMMMKGRKNYLCLHKYHQVFPQGLLLNPDMEETRQKLEKWMKRTVFADRAELPWLSDDDVLWDVLSTSSEQCLGGHCLFWEDCYLTRLRSEAIKARLIIVNHHLFFADLKVKKGGFGEIIPRFEIAIFDEAHNIEEIATTYFGESVSTNQWLEWVGDVEKAIQEIEGINKVKITNALIGVKAAVEELKTQFDGHHEKGRLNPDEMKDIREGPIRHVEQCLMDIQESGITDNMDDTGVQTLVLRANDISQKLNEVTELGNTGWLHWYEKRKRSVVLHASPLDISERMKALLYGKVKTVALTSATLSTHGNFDYIRSRLGLHDDLFEGLLPSHFDFKTQSLLYVPKDLPPPNQPQFASSIANRILKLLERTEGRALVLFTSYHNLNMVYVMLKDKLPFKVLRQGDAPRSILLDEFKEDIHSVLMATGSFWQGVDVPGDALSGLIIDKLPFDSPGEPLIAARIDSIRERGGNPFVEYQLPSAIISLKQGLGRLIRKSTDQGLLAVLDIRLIKSRYGRYFIDSLPDITMTHDLKDVSDFMKR